MQHRGRSQPLSVPFLLAKQGSQSQTLAALQSAGLALWVEGVMKSV